MDYLPPTKQILSFDGESYKVEVTDKRDRTSVITVGRAAIKEEKMADLDAEQAYSTKVKGVNVIINLKDTDLQATKHSKERQFRHAEKISNRAIIQAVELAMVKSSKIMLMANWVTTNRFTLRWSVEEKSQPSTLSQFWICEKDQTRSR